MTKSFPYLALDSAGRRTILCDHPVPMFGDNVTTKKETTKMKTLSADQLTRYVRIRVRNPAAADGIGPGVRARRRTVPWMMRRLKS
jgi:hypothetical protein